MLFQQPVELGIKQMAWGFGQGMGRHPDLLPLTFRALIDITGLFGYRLVFWDLFMSLEKGRYDGQQNR